MRSVVISGLIIFCTTFSAFAEDLPTTGTFEGVYHRDRWGVCHFKFFIVHPDLHNQLAPYEGKPIRLEVTKGSQPMNPGPAIMLAIGKITPLEPSPMQIRISTVPGNVRAKMPFQLILEMVNTADQSLTVPISNVMLRFRCQHKVQPSLDLAKSSWFIKEYTNAQMAVGVLRQVQMGQALLKTSTGGYGNLAHGNSILIPPHDIFPLVVVFDEALDTAEYEIEVSATAWKDKTLLRQARIWQNLDIPTKTSLLVADMEPLRVLQKMVSALEEQYAFEMAVAPPKVQRLRHAGFDTPECADWCGRIHAYAKDGTRIPLKAERVFQRKQWGEYNLPIQGRYKLIDLPEEGIQLRGKFHTASRFSKQPVDRLLVDILTGRGAETLVLATNFNDVQWAPPPPFGKTVQGVKLRVRPAKASVVADQPLRFYLQAVNVSGKAIMWEPRNKSTGNVRIKIDGKAIDLPEDIKSQYGGWGGDWVTSEPEEWSLTLPKHLRLKPGKHTLQYFLRSRRGTYTNANGKSIPLLGRLFSGTLASNTVEFEIK